MLTCLTEFLQDLRQLDGLIDIQGFHQQGPDVHMVILRQCLEEMVHMQDTDHVVDAVLIHWEPGIRRLLQNSDNILPGIIDIDGRHIHPGRHGFRGGNIREIYGRLDKLALLFIQDILILRRFNNRLQLLYLFLRVSAARLPFQRQGDQTDQSHHDQDQGL